VRQPFEKEGKRNPGHLNPFQTPTITERNKKNYYEVSYGKEDRRPNIVGGGRGRE